MGIKRINPVTPGQRFKLAVTFEALTSSRPEKSLLAPIKKSGGRNDTGKMTMRNRGGGHKRRYRIMDFKRNRFESAEVLTVEYDPNRTAFISLVQYADGEKRYIVAPKGIKVGQKITSGPGSTPNLGNALPLGEIPLGTTVHNIEMKPGKGAEICRSAGTSAQLVAKDGKYAVIKLPSGESRMILITCLATIGEVSNADHQLQISGKAGRSRWLGRRPRTRPAAMNPVDHPQGGGEGRSKGGQARTRKGTMSKGLKTRSKKKKSSRLILERKRK
jgi:large subunit ribosomal protein L2|tara:strand:- start:1778 stop:2599 length:822 start_codon:yes stop_codon:yes gene_type:complete